jgi:hypothetical protein
MLKDGEIAEISKAVDVKKVPVPVGAGNGKGSAAAAAAPAAGSAMEAAMLANSNNN